MGDKIKPEQQQNTKTIEESKQIDMELENGMKKDDTNDQKGDEKGDRDGTQHDIDTDHNTMVIQARFNNNRDNSSSKEIKLHVDGDRTENTIFVHWSMSESNFWTQETLSLLYADIKNTVRSELHLRQQLKLEGIRHNVIPPHQIPPNKWEELDVRGSRYDESRQCIRCKQVCFMSGVVCPCHQSNVACLLHAHDLCHHSMKRKHLICWEADSQLKEVIETLEDKMMTIPKNEHEKNSRTDMLIGSKH